MYIELNPEFNGNREGAGPLPINEGDVPVLLPPPLVPVNKPKLLSYAKKIHSNFNKI